MENKRKNNSGIKTFLHLVESSFEAHQSGRIVVFGDGRNCNNKNDNGVDVTVEDIKDNNKGNENKE